MGMYLAPDTGTWNKPKEEREQLRQNNYESNQRSLESALRNAQRAAEQSRHNQSQNQSNLPGIYSPGWTGNNQPQTQPKTQPQTQPKTQTPKPQTQPQPQTQPKPQQQEDQWDKIIDTTPDTPVVPKTPDTPVMPKTSSQTETTPNTANYYEPTGGMVLPPSYPQPTTVTPEIEPPALQEPEPSYTQPVSNYMPYGDPRRREDNNAGIPRAAEEQSGTGLYLNGIDNLIDTNDVPDNEWTPTADNNGSALGGTNYFGNGYVPTNLLRSEDFNRVTPYDPYNTVYSSTGQLREVGLGPNGIYDRPVGISPDDFYYQGGIEAGLSPQEAIEYSLEEHGKEGTTPVFNTVGEMMDYYANEARDNYSDASENIPVNPNRYDPNSTIDNYREGGGPRRDAEFKAGYRNVVNRFDTADRMNDARQDYIGAKLAIDGKTRADYSNAEWNAIEQEAAKYAQGVVEPYESADADYLEAQGKARWDQDAQRQAEVAEQLRNLKNQPRSDYMPYGDPRTKNTPTTGGSQTPVIMSTQSTPSKSSGVNVDQNVVDYINKGGSASKTTNGAGSSTNSGTQTPSTQTGTGSRTTTSTTPSSGSTTGSSNRPGVTNLESLIDNNDMRRPGSDLFDEIIDNSGTTNQSGSNSGSNKNLPGLGTPNGQTANGWIDTTKLPTSGGTTTGGTTTGGTTTGGYTTPRGSEYYRPSYGQGGTVVKAPYKSGGYTETEIQAMGNKPYTTNRGFVGYEGYYQAPNGNWYPVNQQKASYYIRNGGSYRGWNEGMGRYYDKYGYYPQNTNPGGNQKDPHHTDMHSKNAQQQNTQKQNTNTTNRSSASSYGNYYTGNNYDNIYLDPEKRDQNFFRVYNNGKNWSAQ